MRSGRSTDGRRSTTFAASRSSSSAARRRCVPSTASRCEIGAGEFVALEGPSGSGKTTLLQLLGALDRPSGGEVLFEGRDLAKLADRDLAQLRLRSFGFVFQQFNLIPTLTAVENVEAKLSPPAAFVSVRSSCSARWGSPSARIICRPSCRAASSSGSRSRGPCRSSRGSSSPTSRRATSTPRRAARSSSCSPSLAAEHGSTVIVATHDAIAGRAGAAADRDAGRAPGRRTRARVEHAACRAGVARGRLKVAFRTKRRPKGAAMPRKATEAAASTRKPAAKKTTDPPPEEGGAGRSHVGPRGDARVLHPSRRGRRPHRELAARRA